MILILSLIILYMFYYFNGFKCLIRAARRAIPETETETQKTPETGPPVETENRPPAMDRKTLEAVAQSCLHRAGCRFDLWTYCQNKTDFELMDIIKDYNFYHT